MREQDGVNVEIAKQYREQLLNKLFNELYCGDEPMGRADRYDKTRIKQIATHYLEGAGVELPQTGGHANVVERVVRSIEPDERHDIPGAVMATVASEAMFRSNSVLSTQEKQELYARAYNTLFRTEMTQHRGGWTRFYDDVEHRSRVILTDELNDPNLTQAVKYELLALYDLNFNFDKSEAVRSKNWLKHQERRNLARRFGRYLLRGLGATAGMIGPTEFGHERRTDDNGDTDDDWRGHAK